MSMRGTTRKNEAVVAAIGARWSRPTSRHSLGLDSASLQPLTSNLSVSTRKCWRLEFAAIHSKHSPEVRATRKCFGGSLSPIIRLPFSNFAFFVTEKGVKPRQVFSR